MVRSTIVCVAAAVMAVAWIGGSFVCPAVAADWPMLGRDGTRNGVSTEVGAPTEWSIEERKDDRVIQPSRGVRWSSPLGSQTHSSPVVSGGLVWIGTNSVRPGIAARDEVHSVLKCFRVADGKEVYEYDSPKLGPRVHDPGWTGLGSSPLVEGDRLWITTNRSEVLCLDIGPLLRSEGPPRELWKLDLIKEFNVFVHVPLMGPPRPCSIGPSWNGRIFVTINNGVDESRSKVPAPDAPSLVCLNKDTGEVYWKDNSPGANILLTQSSSPTVAEISGRTQVIVPQSDGWARAFDPETGEQLWEFDINPKVSVYSAYHRSDRNWFLANAVVCEDRVYLASGRDVEQGEGIGRLVCIDPTRRGDISSELAVDADGQTLPRRRTQAVNPQADEKALPNPNSALVWEFVRCGKAFEDEMHRAMGSVVVAKDLVIVGDASGLVHCFDAKTGQRHWRHDTFASIWTSPLIVEDKVYVTNEDGNVTIYGLSADPGIALHRVNGQYEPLPEISMGNSIYASPIYADGALYLAARSELFAIAADAQEPDPKEIGGFWPQWRGPDRDNVSADTGLLQEWPMAGPPLLWRVKGLGDGISPVSIRDGRVFALSQYENMEYVRAVQERSGEHLWTAALGASIRLNPLMRWYTQRPPTVDGELLYAMSLPGDLVCLRAANGHEIWRKHYVTDFAGRPTVFGFADCPVIEGEKLICTPGGPDAAIVALDKLTGALLWKSAIPDPGKVTFGNGVVATIDGRRQFIAFFEKALVGVSLTDGNLLWRWDGPVDRTHTPLVRDGLIACLNQQPGYRLLEVKNAAGAFKVKEIFAKPLGHLSRIQDDTVIQGDLLYEPSNGIFSCFNWKNGTVAWQKRMGPMFTSTFADGHFYFHATDGRMSLVEPRLTEPAIKSEFVLPDHRDSLGTTTPLVAGGRLYVREDEQLFCYDVRADSVAPPVAEPKTITLSDPPARLLDEHRERVLRSVFVPTPQDIVDKMLELAAVQQTNVVYDLGSGDGRIVIAAAKKYGCKAVGYELDKELVAQARTKAEAADVKSLVTFEIKDLFTADLGGVDVLTLYLLPKQLEKLAPQLEKMKPGSRIVSHQFEIPGFPPEKTANSVSSEDGVNHTIYLWTLPLKKEKD